MKRTIGFTILFLLAAMAGAQSTTVSTTGVVDTPDGSTWAGGTYSIAFVPSGGLSPAAYSWNGGTMVGHTLFTGALNGSGAFSVSIPSNALIYPTGTQWNIRICPNATSGCFALQTSVSGSTDNLTAALNALAVSPRFPVLPPWTYGYTTAEVVNAIEPGAMFFDTTPAASPACFQWTGTAWVGCSTTGGGSGSGTVSGQANGVIPLATASTTIGAQSALSDNGTTVTSTEPLAAPSVVTGTPTTAAKAALPTGSHGFSCDESPTQFVPAPGVDGFACDSVSHQLLFSSNNSPLAPMAVASPVWPITTPTVTCYGGTPANVTSSLSVGTDGGKTRLVSLLITVTNIGSCNSVGGFGVTLPFTAQTGAVLSCRENTAGASGYGLVNASSASLAVGPFQGLGQSWGVNGYSVLCSGVVQSQ